MEESRFVAYFSMEIALEAGMPTYSGGLGVLAGDTIRSAADLKVPMVAVTLLYRKGYFTQRLDSSGWQTEEPVNWKVERFLQERPERTSVKIEGRTVYIRAWRYDVVGHSAHKVPVYFLDTDLPENAAEDRRLTDSLYGGDLRLRLCQEIILGIGGVRMLRALGYSSIHRFHMNEGHAAFLTFELLDEHLRRNGSKSTSQADMDALRKRCVFTTHTPVPAGHDQFPMEIVRPVLGPHPALEMKEICGSDGILNMTLLALNFSHYVNGVAKKHGEVSSLMFSSYLIDSITNGVHAATWTAKPFQALFDRCIPGWREDNFTLRYALGIPKQEVWDAHIIAKRELLDYVNRQGGVTMDEHVLTLGFARRAATYKRGDLLFYDIERLKRIAARVGKFQVVYAGKAHPKDTQGKALIQRIFLAKQLLRNEIPIAYLENYNLQLAKLITAGVDVWLNTPEPPMEASGTSGMKAALNGVPSLSVLDGWWIEGCIEGVTGWAIGEHKKPPLESSADKTAAFAPAPTPDHSKDALSLYDKLERVIIPMYYHQRPKFMEIMLHSIALNGSFFNTQRMILEYVLKAYFC